MPLILFASHDGNEIREVIAESGVSLMRAAVDNGIDEILAECGGACSCATCHCYIDDRWLPGLEAPSTLESALLEAVMEPAHNSRLSCQITVEEAHEGMLVTLPARQL